jgi:hypothetical protein
MKHKFVLSRPIMLILLFGLLVLLSMAMFFALGIYRVFTGYGLHSPMTNFVSDKFHIAIDYPRTWAAFELPDGSHGDNEVIAFFGFASPITRPKVFIAQKAFANPTLEDIANWGELRLKADSSPYHIVNLNPVTSPNTHAILRYYSTLSITPLGKYKNKCMDWYTFTDSLGYQLSFCTDEGHWSEMESVFVQIAQSFTVIQ